MKTKLFTLTVALLFVVALSWTGLALADNTATVTQTGSDNEASIDQVGHNMAVVLQDGDDNTADIDQSGSNYPNIPGCWYYLGAYIEQDGNSNTASIDMPTSPNAARIQQVGHFNTASQVLGSSQHKTTDWNHMGLHIKQFGNENEAYQETVPNFGCYGIQGMIAEQIGNNNFADQYSIGGMASTMEIYQKGNINHSEQYQDARYSTAHASMVGDYNNTYQYQQYTSWSVSGENNAYIDIFGDWNLADQRQEGEYNEARAGISGNCNEVIQFQDGDNNEANTSQIGDYNYADASQIGNNNFVTQFQTGDGHSSTVTQTGDWNVANITQGL